MLSLPVMIIWVVQPSHQDGEADERGEPEDGEGITEQHGRTDRARLEVGRTP